MNDAKYILRDYQLQKESISFYRVIGEAFLLLTCLGLAGVLMLALSVA